MSFSLLIPYRSDGAHRDVLLKWVHQWWLTNFEGIEVVFGDAGGATFSRGAARNDAFDQSDLDRDIVIAADADTVPTAAGVIDAVAAVRAGASWALPYDEGRYYNLAQASTAAIISSSPSSSDVPEPTDPQDYEHKLTSVAGCLVVPRSAWNELDGYDERFIGWGYEDNAFALALDTIAGPVYRAPSYICHLWHPIADGSNFDQPDIHKNRDLYVRYQKASGDRARMKEVQR